MNTIEPLEARIAPASFVTYTDIDGDLVKVTASAGPLDLNDLTIVPVGVGGQLRSLNITDAGFAGANITFTVTKVATGDGLAHVGSINATGVDLGNVTVKGDLGAIDVGDTNFATPALKTLCARSMGSFGTATLGGDLQSDIRGSIGALKITGDVVGGAGNVSGILESTSGKVGAVNIGGSIRGGSNTASGLIYSFSTMGAVVIGDDIRGGDSSESAYLKADRIGSVLIGGSIVAGIDQDTQADLVHIASIRAGHDIGTITVRGSILGHESANGIVRPVISALGQPTGSARASDLALTSLTVGGRVLFTDVLAGFAPDDTPGGGSNGNASIHTVRVGGDWIASSISAGIRDAAGDGFANGDDYVISDTADLIIARIASITIGGAVIGTQTNPNDHFGFTAQSIGNFKAGLFLAPLTAATDLPIPLALLTGDVQIREV